MSAAAHQDYVQCPRCGLSARASAWQIFGDDAGPCPRCAMRGESVELRWAGGRRFAAPPTPAGRPAAGADRVH